jgi:catechol 2,3-dioxygenase-like lactoylglutathione lyase family enzyme
VPLTGMEHFLVLTDDVEATRAFYCEALGLEVGDRPDLPFPGLWLYLGDVPRVHIAERGPYEAHSERIGIPAARGAAGTGAVDHIAFGAGPDDYDEVAGRLRSAGVEAHANEVPGGIRQLFAHDPNGVKVEINVPPRSSD